MATVTKIDEINKLQTKSRAIPYEKFFGEMNLDADTEEELIEHASILENVMQFFFILIGLGSVDLLDREYLKYQLADRYRAEISSFMTVTDEVSRYVDRFAESIVDNTITNLTDVWYTSDDRAKFVGENESLTLYNYMSYKQAIAKGYKKKKWIAFIDKRTRKTHEQINGKTIPIKDYFSVGNAKMLYPKDLENAINNPEETVNCRCKIQYIK